MAQSIRGTATYRERIALPPTAVFEATLEDVSRADAPADVIARTRAAPPPNPPIRFDIAYDPARIEANHRYVVRARIVVDERLMFTTDTVSPVLTAGNPNTVSLMLRRVSGERPKTTGSPSANPDSAVPLEKTYWKATELGGAPITSADPNREAHLVFEAEGRLAGSDGCNRLVGSYQLTGEAIKFGQLAGTQMACPDSGETERAFRAALGNAKRYRLIGGRLDLYDAAGTHVARFESRVGRSLRLSAERCARTGRNRMAAGQVPGRRRQDADAGRQDEVHH